MGGEAEADIQAAVKGFLADSCGLVPDEVGLDTPLFSSRRLDSIDILRLVAFIEQRFAIAVSPLDVTIERFDTVGRIARFVQDRMPRRA